MRLEQLAVVSCTRDHIEWLVQSMFRHYVEALDVFVNQVGTGLVDRFRMELEGACARNQLVCTNTLTHVSGNGATSANALSATPHACRDRCGTAANLSTLVPL